MFKPNDIVRYDSEFLKTMTTFTDVPKSGIVIEVTEIRETPPHPDFQKPPLVTPELPMVEICQVRWKGEVEPMTVRAEYLTKIA